MFANSFLIIALVAQWTPAEQMKVARVDAPAVSKDGKWAAWTETRMVLEAEKSEQRTHVFVAKTDGSRRFQLTRGDKSANSPQFSPDGKQIYFASDRDGKRQIYRIALAGGEAVKVTSLPDGFSSYEVSPAGKPIALTAVPSDPDRERRVKEKRDFRVVDESFRNALLWTVPADGTGSPRRLTNGAEHVSQFDWSPDSRKIAFVTTPTPEADDSRHSNITEVDVESGKTSVIENAPASANAPRYSPDGRYLVFSRTSEKGRLEPTRLALLDRRTSQTRELPPTENESPVVLNWTPDSKSLLVWESWRTRSAVYVVPVDGPVRVFGRVDRGVTQPPVLDDAHTVAVGVYQTPDAAPEVHVHRLSENKLVPLSAANASAPKHPLGETRVIQWKSKDGGDVEGLLTLPTGYERGKRYPLIVNIHGGPAGVFSEAFLASSSGGYPIASFAAKGYAVLRPNPRGSTAYGQKFRRAVLQDWGGRDFEDIMTGVDKVIADGIADADRMAVMGWSYGGYMTFWTVGQTQRFKAAAAGAGITNHVSMYGTEDIPSVYEDYFDGPPWEQEKIYREQSPLFHVGKVTTPLLILHGAQDPRVPPSQGMEFYRALERRGVKTQMVLYPRTAHGPSEPKFIQDIMERHLAWVEEHLK